MTKKPSLERASAAAAPRPDVGCNQRIVLQGYETGRKAGIVYIYGIYKNKKKGYTSDNAEWCVGNSSLPRYRINGLVTPQKEAHVRDQKRQCPQHTHSPQLNAAHQFYNFVYLLQSHYFFHTAIQSQSQTKTKTSNSINIY